MKEVHEISDRDGRGPRSTEGYEGGVDQVEGRETQTEKGKQKKKIKMREKGEIEREKERDKYIYILLYKRDGDER